MAVTDAEVLSAWKNFFSTGLNWKDLGSDISIDQYRKITDAQHLSNVKRNPVNFLKASGKGFFVDREGYVIALRDELGGIIENEAFKSHMKDILEYRTMEYYRRGDTRETDSQSGKRKVKLWQKEVQSVKSSDASECIVISNERINVIVNKAARS